MREKFVQTGQEQFDADLFDTYSKHLISLIKVDKNILSKMDDGQKTVLFRNFFKFIQEAYFEQFGVLINEDEDIVDYVTLLLAIDKKFAKKLADYVNQYINHVRLQLKRKDKKTKHQAHKLEELRKEAVALAKYLSDPKTLALMVMGHADGDGNIIDYRSNDAMNIRMKSIWKLRGFMQANNMFSGGDAENITRVPKFDPAEYNSIVKCFNPDIFYTLKNEDILNLVEGLVDGYCAMNGVSGPKVEARRFADSGNRITLGTYADGVDTMYLNKELLDAVNKGRASKDPSLPMRIAQTSLHEARHKIQVANMTRTPTSERDKALAFKMNTSLQMAKNGNSSFAGYLSRIEEADARYSAISEMKRLAEQGLLDPSTHKTLEQLYEEERQFRLRSADSTLYESEQFKLEPFRSTAQHAPQSSLYSA